MVDKVIGSAVVEIRAQLDQLRSDLAVVEAEMAKSGATAGAAFSGGWRAKWEQAKIDISAQMHQFDSDMKARSMSGEFDRIPTAAERADVSIEKVGKSISKVVHLAAGLFGIKTVFDIIYNSVESGAAALEKYATRMQRLNSAIYEGKTARDDLLYSIKGQKDAALEFSKAIEEIERKFDEQKNKEVEAGSTPEDARLRRNERVNEAVDALYKRSARERVRADAAAAAESVEAEKRVAADKLSFQEKAVEAAHQAELEAMSEEDRIRRVYADKRKELEYGLVSARESGNTSAIPKIEAGIKALYATESRLLDEINQKRQKAAQQSGEEMSKSMVDAAEKFAAIMRQATLDTTNAVNAINSSLSGERIAAGIAGLTAALDSLLMNNAAAQNNAFQAGSTIQFYGPTQP